MKSIIVQYYDYISCPNFINWYTFNQPLSSIMIKCLKNKTLQLWCESWCLYLASMVYVQLFQFISHTTVETIHTDVNWITRPGHKQCSHNHRVKTEEQTHEPFHHTVRKHRWLHVLSQITCCQKLRLNFKSSSSFQLAIIQHGFASQK